MRNFAGLRAFSIVLLASLRSFAETKVEPSPREIEPKVLQFGIAIAGKFALSSPFCPNDVSCILGSGGGIAARVGHAFRNGWYLGGGYDFSKHDASLLYRLGILQQLRGEVRYHYALGKNWFLVPYGALGFVAYGNEWSIQTAGPGLTIGTAAEVHAGRSVIGFGFSWQGIYLQRLEDPSRAGQYYSAGVPQFLSLELRLEATELF